LVDRGLAARHRFHRGRDRGLCHRHDDTNAVLDDVYLKLTGDRLAA